MFGTLQVVSSDRRAEGLEFVVNPDPEAAFSRNLQDKARIACIPCRTRKVRCSGEEKGCDRCTAIGIQCTYAEQQNKRKRQEEKCGHTSKIVQKVTTTPSPSTAHEEVPRARSQRAFCKNIGLDGLDVMLFHGNHDNEPFLGPWDMNDHVHQGEIHNHGLDNEEATAEYAVDASGQELEFSPVLHGDTTTPAQRAPPTSINPALIPMPSPPKSNSTNDTGYPESFISQFCDDFWTQGQGQSQGGRDLILGEQSATTDSNENECRSATTCGCLMSSVSLLERLAARAASQENRLDVFFDDVRRSIETVSSFIACAQCATRAEQNTLIAVTARKVSLLCVKMARCYKDMHVDCARSTNHLEQKSDVVPPGGSVDISVSTYRATQGEKLLLLQGLVTLQVSELQKLICRMRSRNQVPNRACEEVLQEAYGHLQAARAAVGFS